MTGRRPAGCLLVQLAGCNHVTPILDWFQSMSPRSVEVLDILIKVLSFFIHKENVCLHV